MHTIIHRRQGRSYELLERIANGFGIPRGMMGLGTDYPAPAAVGADLPVFDHASDAEPVGPVSRVGVGDVAMLDAMVDRLRTLDQEQGGQTVAAATAALLQRAHGMVRARMNDRTRAKLFGFLAHTHSFVGWQLSDAGQYSRARGHFQHSVTAGHHGRNHPAVARTLHLAARNELIWCDPQHAVKLFQFAELAADNAHSPLLSATIIADASIVLAEHGHTEIATTYMSRATDLLGNVDFATDPAPWFQTSDVTSALSAARFHLGQRDDAITEITDALDLAADVTSARLPVRLAPAAHAATRYNTSDTRDLAHRIHTLG